MTFRPFSLRCRAAFAVLAATSGAWAQSDATAELLFRDGKKLMAEKRYDEACPKFAESARLSPSSGVELALGLCYEAQGKTASAWGAFTAVVPLARRDARKDRERAAIGHASALEPKLARVTFSVEPASAALPGFELREDGQVLGSAAWADSTVDPGDHTVVAKAPGYVTYTTSFTSVDGSTSNITIPPLSLAERPPAPVVARPSSSLRTVGLVVGAGGLVALGAGAIVGAMALGKVSSAQKSCPGSPCSDSAAVSENQTGGTLADASTGLFVAGGVLAGAGVLTFLLAPAASVRTAHGQLVLGPSFAGWRGEF